MLRSTAFPPEKGRSPQHKNNMAQGSCRVPVRAGERHPSDGKHHAMPEILHALLGLSAPRPDCRCLKRLPRSADSSPLLQSALRHARMRDVLVARPAAFRSEIVCRARRFGKKKTQASPKPRHTPKRVTAQLCKRSERLVSPEERQPPVFHARVLHREGKTIFRVRCRVGSTHQWLARSTNRLAFSDSMA